MVCAEQQGGGVAQAQRVSGGERKGCGLGGLKKKKGIYRAAAMCQARLLVLGY